MIMSKKVLNIMSILIAVCMLTGCIRASEVIDTTKSKKTYTMTAKVWYNKDKADKYASGAASVGDTSDLGMDAATIGLMLQQIQNYPVVKIGGKKYYKTDMPADKKQYYPKDKDSNMIVTKTSIYIGGPMDSFSGTDLEQAKALADQVSDIIEKIEIKAHFSEPVTNTNGKLSKDKKTVTFSFNMKKLTNPDSVEIYAYTKSSKRDISKDREPYKKMIQ